jgi:hypothetical protein
MIVMRDEDIDSETYHRIFKFSTDADIPKIFATVVKAFFRTFNVMRGTYD